MKQLDRLPARVNITLDVFTDGAQEKKELPMRLLLLGDFSQKKDRVEPARRERLSITPTDYQQVLAYLNPTLILSVPAVLKDASDQEQVQLSFETLQDFHPESLVKRVPTLKRLMAMRSLLSELQADIINNKKFKQQLKQVLENQEAVSICQTELERLSDD